MLLKFVEGCKNLPKFEIFLLFFCKTLGENVKPLTFAQFLKSTEDFAFSTIFSMKNFEIVSSVRCHSSGPPLG